MSLAALILGIAVLFGNAWAIWWLYERQERQAKRLAVHSRRLRKAEEKRPPRPSAQAMLANTVSTPGIPQTQRPPTIPEWRATRAKAREVA